MNRPSKWLPSIVLVVTAFVVAACCGAVEGEKIASGNYGDPVPQPNPSLEPYASVEPTITVDRDNGIVIVRYEHEGAAVVERWRVTDP